MTKPEPVQPAESVSATERTVNPDSWLPDYGRAVAQNIADRLTALASETREKAPTKPSEAVRPFAPPLNDEWTACKLKGFGGVKWIEWQEHVRLLDGGKWEAKYAVRITGCYDTMNIRVGATVSPPYPEFRKKLYGAILSLLGAPAFKAFLEDDGYQHRWLKEALAYKMACVIGGMHHKPIRKNTVDWAKWSELPSIFPGKRVFLVQVRKREDWRNLSPVLFVVAEEKNPTDAWREKQSARLFDMLKGAFPFIRGPFLNVTNDLIWASFPRTATE